MYLTKRQHEIFAMILSNHCVVDEILMQLQITSKTLKNNVDTLNENLFPYESKIVYKLDRLELVSNYPNAHWINLLCLYVKISDIDLVILNLLLIDEYITILDLSEKCFMSKSKVEKLLLSTDNLSLELTKTRNLGVKFDYDVLTRFNYFSEILNKYIDDLNYLVTTRLLIKQVMNQEIPIDLYNKAVDILTTKLSLEDKSIFIIKKIFTNILLLIITEHEDLITTYIDQIKNKQFDEATIKPIVAKTINSVFVEYSINKPDTKIYSNIIDHLLRLIDNSYLPSCLTDTLKESIKSRFSYAYEISQTILARLGLELATKFDEEDIYFLTIYIQSMLENHHDKKKVDILIVCEHGLSVSNYIASKISTKLTSNINVKILSIYEYNKLTNSNFDIVITTIKNLEAKTALVFKCSPLISDDEISKIDDLINKKLLLNNLEVLLDAKHFYDAKNYNSIDEFYQAILPSLEEDGLIDSEFGMSLKKRVNSGLYDVNGVKILHASKQLVLKNKIVIIKNVDNFDEAKMFFMFLFNEEFMLENNYFINQLYKVITDEDLMRSVTSATNFNQVKFLLTSYIKEKNAYK